MISLLSDSMNGAIQLVPFDPAWQVSGMITYDDSWIPAKTIVGHSYCSFSSSVSYRRIEPVLLSQNIPI